MSRIRLSNNRTIWALRNVYIYIYYVVLDNDIYNDPQNQNVSIFRIYILTREAHNAYRTRNRRFFPAAYRSISLYSTFFISLSIYIYIYKSKPCARKIVNRRVNLSQDLDNYLSAKRAHERVCVCVCASRSINLLYRSIVSAAAAACRPCTAYFSLLPSRSSVLFFRVYTYALANFVRFFCFCVSDFARKFPCTYTDIFTAARRRLFIIHGGNELEKVWNIYRYIMLILIERRSLKSFFFIITKGKHWNSYYTHCSIYIRAF